MKKLLAVWVLIFPIFIGVAFLRPVSARAQAETKVVFEKRKIKIGKRVLSVEVADSMEKRAQGLMFRESLPKDHGMLFVFENEEQLAFWMKNTLIPLSIGYFDRNRKLINSMEMEPAPATEMNPKTYHSAKPAMYALEMTKGWFSRNKVGPGTAFTFVSGH